MLNFSPNSQYLKIHFPVSDLSPISICFCPKKDIIKRVLDAWVTIKILTAKKRHFTQLGHVECSELHFNFARNNFPMVFSWFSRGDLS